jgi:hypothetical protein
MSKTRSRNAGKKPAANRRGPPRKLARYSAIIRLWWYANVISNPAGTRYDKSCGRLRLFLTSKYDEKVSRFTVWREVKFLGLDKLTEVAAFENTRKLTAGESLHFGAPLPEYIS